MGTMAVNTRASSRRCARAPGAYIAVLALLMLAVGGQRRAEVLPGPEGEWHQPGGPLGSTRYSPLARITTANVKNLGGAWMTRLTGAARQITPIVAGGLMYISTADRYVYGLDAKTGRIVWEQRLEQVPGARGVSVGADVGLVFVPQTKGRLDGSIVALSAETGKRVWTYTMAEDPATGRRSGVTTAPLYIKGVLIVPGTGGDDGRRCPVVALDALTGKELWRFYTVPGPGEIGHDTWPADNDSWKWGGGAVWTTPAADPDLGLVYIGTGNASGSSFGVGPLNAHPLLSEQPQPAVAGEIRKGDNLFNASIVAVDLKTGRYRWHFQLVRHDIFEMDVSAPPLLFDAVIAGTPRKGIAAMRGDGYLFLLDRVTGQPFGPIEDRPVKQDARLLTAPTQPFPASAEQIVPNCVEPELIPPGFVGECYFAPIHMDRPNVMVPFAAVRQSPISYSPRTGLFYISASVHPWWMTRYGWTRNVPGTKQYGLLVAVDGGTNRIVWRKRLPYQLGFGGGTLATAGDLIFHGEPDGNLQAYDARSGELLWQFQTGAGADSPAMTYELGGEQYVAIAPRDGNAVWAFKLGGMLKPLPPAPPPALEVPFSGAVASTTQVTIDVSVRARDTDRLSGVSIDDYASLDPVRIRVPAGATITWKNEGRAVHTATVREAAWSTGDIAPGATGSITFPKAGTYTYACRLHPWSVGQIIVEPSDGNGVTR
jgi:quinohemoprotein ethanol dehydrogenase